ncbi:hypothetical protein CRP01_40715 [Flavilitoribacter nigricans DSM 23189 = NBRC 102662]|uniref:Uncharacterized protein n=1 Tax=Flavilitoribacter nigricans (strain ATCC 23147 / DSM 23189 / NBRC 102662 / NCIMB 1420 / SS-2) TaxID=1122177 RepID=A0A2D0MWS9_FLAN2|nr:hypothetical protein CRP01_40715 [Flavilitoribacter nigricans DSM 23189 = NBRC 102662]
MHILKLVFYVIRFYNKILEKLITKNGKIWPETGWRLRMIPIHPGTRIGNGFSCKYYVGNG